MPPIFGECLTYTPQHLFNQRKGGLKNKIVISFISKKVKSVILPKATASSKRAPYEGDTLYLQSAPRSRTSVYFPFLTFIFYIYYNIIFLSCQVFVLMRGRYFRLSPLLIRLLLFLLDFCHRIKTLTFLSYIYIIT